MRPIEFGFGFYLSLSAWSVSDPVVWMCALMLRRRRHVIGVSEKEYLSVVKTILLDLLQWFVLPTLGRKSKFFLLQRGSMISLWASSREYFYFKRNGHTGQGITKFSSRDMISPRNLLGQCYIFLILCRLSTENEFGIRKVSRPWSAKLAHYSHVLPCLPFKNHTWTDDSGHENWILKIEEICTKGVMQYTICLHDIMSIRNTFWPSLPDIVRCPASISFPGHT